MRKTSQSAQRRQRSDAQRNRERILDVAKRAFTRHGADASLDEIAKQAGVGAGTLYRHFPSRDALIEARKDLASLERLTRSGVDTALVACRREIVTDDVGSTI